MMDWVQWYVVAAGAFLLGLATADDDPHAVPSVLILTALSTPVVGRVFGWW